MPKLLIRECRYHAQLDEAAFFGWLQSISGVVKVLGTPDGLVVTLRSKRLSQPALRDLLALYFRYGLPMQDLAQFETPENKQWFRSPQAYWYARVFEQ
ncbi:MAG: hypothetical protein R3E36_10115 [Nitrosomonas sp.]|nr:hypothetical protein [Nitrosomonas sp.]